MAVRGGLKPVIVPNHRFAGGSATTSPARQHMDRWMCEEGGQAVFLASFTDDAKGQCWALLLLRHDGPAQRLVGLVCTVSSTELP